MSVGETIPLFRLDDVSVLGERNVWQVALDQAYDTEVEMASLSGESDPNDLVADAERRLKMPFPQDPLGSDLSVYAYSLAYKLNAHHYEDPNYIKDVWDRNDQMQSYTYRWRALIPEVAARNGLSLSALRVRDHSKVDELHQIHAEGEQS